MMPRIISGYSGNLCVPTMHKEVISTEKLHVSLAAQKALEALKESELPGDPTKIVLKYHEDAKCLPLLRNRYTIGGVPCMIADSLIFCGIIGGEYDYDYLGDSLRRDKEEFGTYPKLAFG